MSPVEQTGQGAAPRPVPTLDGLRAYASPRHPAPTDLVLSGNEGDKPPASLLKWVAGCDVGLLRSYPSARELERQLAERLGVEPSQVAVTAGGDEGIDRLFRGFLAPGRRVVMPQPTFVMLPHYARLAGAEIDTIDWPDGPYPTEAVVAAVNEQTAMITVVSPNNPHGGVASARDLEVLAEAAPHAVLLVDLAYCEYADEDLTAAALRLPNAVVIRTISKAWGLAGLRVGYAAGPAPVIDVLRAAGSPYSVSGLSVALAQRALSTGEGDRDRHVAKVRRERDDLVALATELGLSAPDGQGNFVLIRTSDPSWLRDGLAGLGIAVRSFPGEPGLEDCVRITCPGDEADYRRLERAIRSVLRPDGVLFDLDGVLADVSRSYRLAIEQTAASYGVTLGEGDVAALKAEGDANNDWEVTHRLLAAAGVEADLAEVTARFEELYQGTADDPGLYRNERMLPSKELLLRLARRLPLGIVTGRPRGDAERWLRDNDLEEVFGAVVCMEDAALKPDPAPVEEALRRLGISNAWMLGDTPDDVRAARAAGVVPIGLPAPSDDEARATDVLLRAGAARVVPNVGAIEGLL